MDSLHSAYAEPPDVQRSAAGGPHDININWEIAYVKFPCNATVAWNTILKQQIKLKSRPNRQNIWKNYTS